MIQMRRGLSTGARFVREINLNVSYRANAYRALDVHGGGVLLELAMCLFRLILQSGGGGRGAERKTNSKIGGTWRAHLTNTRPLCWLTRIQPCFKNQFLNTLLISARRRMARSPFPDESVDGDVGGARRSE